MSSKRSDLQHRDWLLFSSKRLLQTVNYNISVMINDTPNGGKLLVAQNISEKDIDNLPFLTNTDQNNNYLYLQDFNVYIEGSFTPQNLPGLKDVVMNAYTSTDADSFLKKEDLHFPFMVKNFENSDFKGTNFSQFVDQYSGLLPFTTNTIGYVKTYEVVLNPDLTVSTIGSGVSGNTSGTFMGLNSAGRQANFPVGGP
jgi:hypothetical protein